MQTSKSDHLRGWKSIALQVFSTGYMNAPHSIYCLYSHSTDEQTEAQWRDIPCPGTIVLLMVESVVDSVLQRAFFSKVWEDTPHIWYLNKLSILGLPSAFPQGSSHERGTYRRCLPAVPDSVACDWMGPASILVSAYSPLSELALLPPPGFHFLFSWKPKEEKGRQERRGFQA